MITVVYVNQPINYKKICVLKIVLVDILKLKIMCAYLAVKIVYYVQKINALNV